MENREKQIKKFLNLFGLRYDIEITREGYIKRNGNQFKCVTVQVWRENNLEYKQHHCFQITPNSIFWDEGNTEKGISEGILKYFGDDTAMHFYFKDLAKDVVTNN